jgi:hypothetical protein
MLNQKEEEERIEKIADAYANKTILSLLEKILERMDDMATKGDLKEMREEMKEEMKEGEGRITKTLRAKANENHLNLTEHINQAIGLIGIHTQDKGPQSQHKQLETRVEKIESHLQLAA